MRSFVLAAAGVYAVLTLALTWPVAAELTTHVPFYNDTWIFVWDLWWFKTALLSPTLGLYATPLVFHPGGVPLAFHTLTPANGLLALPLIDTFGVVAAHTLVFLASFVLTATSMAALALKLTGSRAGALLAGFLFAFSPYRLAHGYHLNLLSLETVPLFAWAFLAFLARPRWATALVSAALAAASYYLCLVYGSFVWLLAAVLALHALVSGKTRLSADLVGRGAGMAALSALFLLPALIPALAEAVVEPYYFDPVDQRFSADLASWITPSLQHPLWGGYTMKVYQHFPGVLAEWTTYVGFTVLVLVAAAWTLRRTEAVGRWFTVAAVFAVLASGPTLQFLGRDLGVPLPYRLFKLVPVLNSLREPSRFAALVTLATSVLAAYGVKALGRRTAGEWRVAAVAFALALIEFLPTPLPTTSAVVPAFLHQLAREPGDFAVLEAPPSWAHREHLYHQTVHGKSISEGYIARIPATTLRFVDTWPLAQDPADWVLTPERARALAASARRYDVRYALVYRELYLKRQRPEGFDRALTNLLALPGATIASREADFAAVRFSGAAP